MQQQLAQRTRIHVDSLGALEGTIQRLTTECQRLQCSLTFIFIFVGELISRRTISAAHDGLLDEVASMRAAIREYVERGNVIFFWIGIAGFWQTNMYYVIGSPGRMAWRFAPRDANYGGLDGPGDGRRQRRARGSAPRYAGLFYLTKITYLHWPFCSWIFARWGTKQGIYAWRGWFTRLLQIHKLTKRGE